MLEFMMINDSTRIYALPQVAWFFMRAQYAHAYMSRSYFHAGRKINCRELEEIPLRH